MTFSLDNVFVFFGRRLLFVNLGSQIVNTILPNKTTTKKKPKTSDRGGVDYRDERAVNGPTLSYINYTTNNILLYVWS